MTKDVWLVRWVAWLAIMLRIRRITVGMRTVVVVRVVSRSNIGKIIDAPILDGTVIAMTRTSSLTLRLRPVSRVPRSFRTAGSVRSTNGLVHSALLATPIMIDPSEILEAN